MTSRRIAGLVPLLMASCLLITKVTEVQPGITLADVPQRVDLEPASLAITGTVVDRSKVFAGKVALLDGETQVAEEAVLGAQRFTLQWPVPPNEAEVVHSLAVRLYDRSGALRAEATAIVTAATQITASCPATSVGRLATCSATHAGQPTPVTWSTADMPLPFGHVTPSSAGSLSLVAQSVLRADVVATTTLEAVALTAPVVAAPTYVTEGKSGYSASAISEAGQSYAWSAGGLTIQVQGQETVVFSAGAVGRGTLTCTAINSLGDTATTVTDVTIVPLPAAPTVTAPAITTINRPIQASLVAVTGETYAWQVSNGAFLSPAQGAVVQIAAGGSVGSMLITATAANLAGDTTDSSPAAVTVGASGVAVFVGTQGVSGFVDANGVTAKFNQPRGLAFTPDGTLYVADYGNNVLRRVSTSGGVTAVTGPTGVSGPKSIAYLPSSGLLYFVDGDGTCLRSLDPLTGATIRIAGLCGVAGDHDNDFSLNARFQSMSTVVAGEPNTLYVSDYGRNSVHRVDLVLTTTSTVLPNGGTANNGGTGGPSGTAKLCCPEALAFRSDGLLMIGQSGWDRYLVNTQTLDIWNMGNGGLCRFSKHATFDRRGDLYVTANGPDCLEHIVLDATDIASKTPFPIAQFSRALGNGSTGFGIPPTSGAYGDPSGVALDPLTGDLFVASVENHVIVRLRQP